MNGNTKDGQANRATVKRTKLIRIAVVTAAVTLTGLWIWQRLGLPVPDAALLYGMPPYSEGIVVADVAALRNSAAAELLENLEQALLAEGRDETLGYGLSLEAVDRIAGAAWRQPGHLEGSEWRIVLEGAGEAITGGTQTDTDAGTGWLLTRDESPDLTVVGIRETRRMVAVAPLSFWNALHPEPEPEQPDPTRTGPGRWLMDTWNGLPETAWLRAAARSGGMRADGRGIPEIVRAMTDGRIAGGALWSTVAEGARGTVETVLMLEAGPEAEPGEMREVQLALEFGARLYALERLGPDRDVGLMAVWSPPESYEGPERTGLVWTAGIEELFEVLTAE